MKYQNITQTPWLFELESTAATQYTSQMIGEPDFVRLLQGKPDIFRAVGGAKEAKRRALVIQSTVFLIFSESQNSLFKACLAQLLAVGTEIFILGEDHYALEKLHDYPEKVIFHPPIKSIADLLEWEAGIPGSVLRGKTAKDILIFNEFHAYQLCALANHEPLSQTLKLNVRIAGEFLAAGINLNLYCEYLNECLDVKHTWFQSAHCDFLDNASRRLMAQGEQVEFDIKILILDDTRSRFIDELISSINKGQVPVYHQLKLTCGMTVQGKQLLQKVIEQRIKFNEIYFKGFDFDTFDSQTIGVLLNPCISTLVINDCENVRTLVEILQQNSIASPYIKRLKCVDVSANQDDEEDPLLCLNKHFPELEYLVFQNVKIESISPNSIESNNKLNKISFINCEICHDALAHVRQAGVCLELINCQEEGENDRNDTPQGTEAPGSSAENPRVSYANHVLKIDDELMDEDKDLLMSVDFPSLKKFHVSDSFLALSFLETMLSKMHSIRSLNLTTWVFNPRLLEESFFPELVTLKLCVTESISDEHIQYFIDRAPRLRELYISAGCTNYIMLPHDSELEIIKAENCEFENLPKKLWMKNIFEMPLEASCDQAGCDANFNGVATDATVTHCFVNRNDKKVSPNLHRDTLYNGLTLNPGEFSGDNDSALPFSLIEIEPSLFVERPIRRVKSGIKSIFNSQKNHNLPNNIYRGKVRKKIGQNWTPLPSLSPNEVISHICVSGLEFGDYDVQFSQSNNKHYIRLTDQGMELQDVIIDFVLHVPKIDISLLDQSLYELILAYENSEKTSLTFTDGRDTHTAQEWLSALIENRAGACRHRSIAFFAQAVETFPDYVTHMVWNSSHAFIEIGSRSGGPCFTAQLGGVEAGIVKTKDAFDEPDQDIERREVPDNPAFLGNVSLFLTLPAMKFILKGYDGQKIRLDLAGNREVDNLQRKLRQIACEENIPLYYIHSIDDLHCIGTWLSRDSHNETVITRGAGGPLYAYLMKPHVISPILLVNWNNFSAEEIVSSNSLLDATRRIDGFELPMNMRVIGLYNPNKEDAYTESDFDRRHDAVYVANIDPEAHISVPIPLDESRQKYSVDLYSSDDFESMLIGSWRFNGETIPFEEGAILHALKNNQILELRDPPLHIPEFVVLINKLTLDRKITILGVEYRIPKDFVVWGQSRSLESLVTEALTIIPLGANECLPAGIQVLNPLCFSNLFGKVELTGDLLYSTPGIIDSVPNNEPLRLFLSHSISDAQWARLLHTAMKKNRSLLIYPAFNADLPAYFAPCVRLNQSVEQTRNYWGIEVFEVSSRRSALQAIKISHENPLIIDCGQINGSELFEAILPISTHPIPKFKKIMGAAFQAFMQNRVVVLTGDISHGLEQELVQFALTYPGINQLLYVVTDKPLHSLKSISLYHYYDGFPKDEITVINRHESNDSHFNWMYDPMYTRATALMSGLILSRLVILNGTTGVGKTTFMLDHFNQYASVKIFNGLNSIHEWANYSGFDLQPILFIDEANITSITKEEYTCFAGMLNNNPPQIVYGREIITLTPQHRVVFAGNPVEYGGERYTPKLFTQYSHSVVHFKPLERQYLYQAIIQKIIPQYADLVGEILLDAYFNAQSKSTEETFITPRALTLMCHLFLMYSSQSEMSLDTLINIAGYLSESVVNKSVPKHARKPCVWNKLFFDPDGVQNRPNFILTPSRYPAYAALEELLFLRHQKRLGLMSHGISGLILEGEPASGKSEMIKAILAQSIMPDEVFHLSLLMPAEEKRNLLIEAYCAGGVVVIDEINCTFMMEDLINDLLSGTYATERVVKPGFTILATQNSAHKKGRRLLSEAAYQRFLHVDVPDYPPNELSYILMKTFDIPFALAAEIVYDFNQVADKQKPKLGLRDLFRHYFNAIEHVSTTLAERFVDLGDARKRILMRYFSPQNGGANSASQATFIQTSFIAAPGQQQAHGEPSSVNAFVTPSFQ